MLLFAYSLLLFLLFVIAFQDFKQRQIHWWLIPLLFIVLLIIALQQVLAEELMYFALFNFCFISIQLILLTTYISVKNKKIVNIINSYLGIGDILFFIVICVGFSPANFVVFYLGSLMFALLSFLIYNITTKKASKEIPLAGIMATAMIAAILIAQWQKQINFYNDSLLLNFFNIQ